MRERPEIPAPPAPAADDGMVEVVLESEPNDRGWTLVHGVTVPGDFIFKVGEPKRVPRAFAEALVANNPEPWQGKGHAIYRIIEGGEG